MDLVAVTLWQMDQRSFLILLMVCTGVTLHLLMIQGSQGLQSNQRPQRLTNMELEVVCDNIYQSYYLH